MSKMYEALQQAKGDKQSLRQPTFVASEQVGTVARLSLETEMLGLYHALNNALPDLKQKVILFLGARGGEGTSTVVSSLARVAAEHLNHKVAILDIDTLHPTQHRLFGVNPGFGWDDVLRRAQPAEKAIYQTKEKGLYIVPLSSTKVGAVQVIDAPGMEVLFGALRERFDLVLIDCAPAAAFPDSIALSRKTDGVVLVIEAESTRWPVAETVCQQVTKAGGKAIGIVFNKRRYYIPKLLYNRL